MIEMILSKKEYKKYLIADYKSLGCSNFSLIWLYQKNLRKLEYYKNCLKSKNFIFALIYYFILIRHLIFNLVFGFSIHPNNFGPGLAIVHYGTIIISPNAKIGANCRIHVCTNIGTKAGTHNHTPIIGNNVYIGPGAKIFGKIQISDGIAIAANAVVNKDFLEKNISIGGVPAKKISNRGSKGLLREGFNL